MQKGLLFKDIWPCLIFKLKPHSVSYIRMMSRKMNEIVMNQNRYWYLCYYYVRMKYSKKYSKASRKKYSYHKFLTTYIRDINEMVIGEHKAFLDTCITGDKEKLDYIINSLPQRLKWIEDLTIETSYWYQPGAKKVLPIDIEGYCICKYI